MESNPSVSISGARRAAAAVTARAHEVSKWRERHVEVAHVRGVNPDLTAEFTGSEHLLVEGENLRVSQFVRWWDVNYVILPGDALIVIPLISAEYLAIDVLTGRPVTAGIRPSRPPSGPGKEMLPAQASSMSGLLSVTVTVDPDTSAASAAVHWGYSIVKKLEVYDADGTRIGWVPVFGSLP